MAETLLDAVAAEMDAMAAKVAELEQYNDKLYRESYKQVNALIASCEAAEAEAAKWRRYHDGARAALCLAAAVAAIGWGGFLWQSARIGGWL